jgi:hypothetical protein
MHKRIYFSANFICILLFLHGCASSPGSSSNSSSRDSAKAKSTTSSQKKLSSVENISSTESISKNESPSTFDENSNLRSAAESIEHQGGEVDPTIKESVQTAPTEKFEQSIDVHEDHFPEEKEKKLDTPSIADSSLILQEHSELKSFFDSKQENENSNANKKDGSFLSPSAGFENKTNKPVNLNPAQTRIDFLEGNQSDNSKLAIDSHLQKKSYPSGNILLGNSDLPVSNPREHESNFTNEKKMISVDNKNLKSKFSPRTSSVEIIDPISETENKVGFRGVDKDKDSSLYRQKEVSFLAEPSEDFIKDESDQLSKIVSFKDEPNKDIEKQNTKAQGNIAFSKKNKPLSSSIIKTMPSVGYSDPISNKTQDHIFNTPSTALKHRPERELGYNNLKSFLDRNEDPTSKTSKDEENKFLNVRGYLEEAREEQPDYNLSEGIIKGKTRFLRTLEWIENRGRVQEDLQTE